MRRISVVWFVALALALSLIGTLAMPVRAATITVNTTADVIDNESGDCSLREAIAAANTNIAVDACPAGEAGPAVDTINVPAGTYILLDGELEVAESVAIVGGGAAPGATVIDGNDDDQVFALDAGAVAISNMTITKGAAEDTNGGGIYVGQSASLTLTNSVVVDNHASDAGSGGGIYVEDGATATISGSNVGTVLSPNTTEEDGGGIFVGEGSTLTVNGGSTVTGNTAGEDGGGIYIDGNSEGASTATVSGSTISGNAAESDGGGIFVNDPSTATITNSTISGNAAGDDGDGDGGGISADGSAILNGSTVTMNAAEFGGGIYVDTDGTASLTNSTVSGNDAGDGGGLWLDGTVTLDASVITDNAADDQGGGIYIYLDGTANVNNGSVVSGNTAWEGGGVANEGSDTLNLTGSSVSGNTAGGDGGGIWNRWDGTANIVASTISGNTAGADVETAGRGGGIFSDDCCQGGVTVTNSTVSGNQADADGGGIFVDGNLEMLFSTVASNTAGSEGEGGGIWTQGSAAFYGTLVANNGAAGDCHHNDTGVDTFGSNLDTDDTCDFSHPDDIADADAKLGALATNAPGSTQTHALQFDSPAVDAVEPASFELVEAEFLLVGQVVLPACVATDQRGVARPQDGDSDGLAVCDIGSYELLPPAISINDVTVTEGDTGTVDAVFTVTLSRPSTGSITVAFATANGTATVVADYQAATGTVTFAPTDVSETITVRVVGDLIDEPNETFFVNLTAPLDATLADGQGTGNILDDEGPIVTLAPTAAPAAAALPDTGTGNGLADWGAPGIAIGLMVVSAAVLIRNRRRHVRAR